MRLGAPILQSYDSPDTWIAQLKQRKYSAAYCPDLAEGIPITDYADAAQKANIMIAEVGVWNNPLNIEDDLRQQAIHYCQERLALADEIGASCCVNIAGSRGHKWDGPHANDLTAETFELIVETVRQIIDAVKPTRTYYCLETMPWMYPDSVDSYLALIEAIDRKSFAVHFDPVNLINSPQVYFRNADLIHQFISSLGLHIKSVHAKDILLQDNLTVHLNEVRPGLGGLDYGKLLNELNLLGPDIPVMVEHLQTSDEYDQATSYIRQKAQEISVNILQSG